MSESDKGFSFKRLFFRDAEPEAQPAPVQQSEPVNNKVETSYLTNNLNFSPSGNTSNAQEQSLVEDFVKRLQNLINQNNQPGFDFLEFTESLFEEKQNPSPEVYKTVFRIAQKIDKSLTPSRLLESAMYYKGLVQSTVKTEISKGEAKKQGLQGEKDTERTNLDSNLRDTRSKIQQLTQQIQELQNQDLTLSNQLLAIDQKYNGQFIEIDRKINAIRNAAEQVIVSIVDIEAGIKSNLS
jgi:hypothetical protein